jgi:hypothetical protein
VNIYIFYLFFVWVWNSVSRCKGRT